MNKKLASILILSLAIAGRGAAQTPDLMRELLSLDYTAKLSQVNFNIAYYYQEDDSAGISYDTLSGNGTVFTGKSYMRLNGLKRINNDRYNVIIDTVNKEIYVSDAEDPVKNYMGDRFTDAAYMNSYIDSAAFTDSAGYRIAAIAFKEVAPFNWYRVAYDTLHKRPAYIQYSMKKDSDTGGMAQAIRLKIVFTSFSTEEVEPKTLFDTDVWFTRRNGVLTLQPPYSTDYTITDLTTKEY